MKKNRVWVVEMHDSQGWYPCTYGEIYKKDAIINRKLIMENWPCTKKSNFRVVCYEAKESE